MNKTGIANISWKPYFKKAQLNWQLGLEYRFGVLYLLLEAFLPVTAMILLWKSIYEQGGTIAGYSMNQMVTYFIAARLVNYLVWYSMDWKMNEMVNQGTLSSLLSRPIDVQMYYFFDMIGNRIVNLILGCIPLGIITFFIRGYISINHDLREVLLGVLALMLACCLWFFLAWVVGCYVFWAQNIINLLFVKELVVMVLAGGFFPVDILPASIVHFIKLTPFPYLGFFPITILVNGISWTELWNGLLMQGIWLVILFVIGRILWRVGLARYTAVGG